MQTPYNESRLQEIEAEMKRVRAEMRVLRTTMTGPKPWTRILRLLGRRHPGAAAGTPPPPPAPPPTGLRPKPPAPVANPGVPDSASVLPLAPPVAKPSPLSEARSSTERFASYFMTGSLQGMRPLRLEQRIVRNRAIAMILLVILMLIWVLSLI